MFGKRWQAVLQELVDLVGRDRVREIEIERRMFGGGRIRVAGGTQQLEHPVSPPPVPVDRDVS